MSATISQQQRGSVRIIDLAWHRDRGKRAAAAEHYQRMFEDEREPNGHVMWIPDYILAEESGLTVREVRFLMENGLPHIKWNRWWVTNRLPDRVE